LFVEKDYRGRAFGQQISLGDDGQKKQYNRDEKIGTHWTVYGCP
jgi:hypothetical protein